jgi:hypothetical protein
VPIPVGTQGGNYGQTMRRSFTARMVASAMFMATVSAVLFADDQVGAGTVMALLALVPVALAIIVRRHQ